MNWRALLKILAVAAGALGVQQGTEALDLSGKEVIGQIISVAAIVGAYLMRQPVGAGATPPPPPKLDK